MTEEETQILLRIYSDAERAVAGFQKATGAVCPDGCGICCTRFTPDILPVEAEFLSDWILRHQPDQGRLFLAQDPGCFADCGSGDPCPLYRSDNPLHCSVYEGRPLICRLFGFSSMATKKGELEWSDCRYMELPPGMSRNWRCSPGTAEAPPLAELFGRQVHEVRPADSCQRELLPAALYRALNKQLMLDRLSRRSRGFGSNDDDDQPPLKGPSGATSAA